MKPFAIRWDDEQPYDEVIAKGPERIAIYDQQMLGDGTRDMTTGLISIAFEVCTSRSTLAEPIAGECTTLDLTEEDAMWLVLQLDKLLHKRKSAENARDRAQKAKAK